MNFSVGPYMNMSTYVYICAWTCVNVYMFEYAYMFTCELGGDKHKNDWNIFKCFLVLIRKKISKGNSLKKRNVFNLKQTMKIFKIFCERKIKNLLELNSEPKAPQYPPTKKEGKNIYWQHKQPVHGLKISKSLDNSHSAIYPLLYKLKIIEFNQVNLENDKIYFILRYDHLHHQDIRIARIPMTFSRHPPYQLSLSKSSSQHPLSTHSWRIEVFPDRSTLLCQCVGQ